ncbi:MAG: S8 family serine peptidase, partial [Muribaculaceae bacterium]|nr:S8 family serine peptidase [Muribaculaceae bacterium]
QRSHTMIMTSINQLQYDNRTVIGLKIRGKAGHRMHMTTDGNLQLSSFDIDGAENGNPDLSISSLVCGDNIISVGAHVTRTGNGCLDGNTHSIFNYFYPAECGAAAYFSSYAVLPDGRTYPTITAPGNEVISSYSRYYTAKLSENELGSYTAYATDAEGERHYWQTECGTSASAPFVAGTVATWLEADPSLTPGEIKDILCRTATSDSYSQNIDTPARFGYGKVGSLAGLNEVISRKTATEGIMAETDGIIIYGKEKRYTISVFGAEYIRAELYDISGRRIAYHKADCEYLLADYSECPTGIYILSVAAGSDFHNPAVCNTYKIALI